MCVNEQIQKKYKRSALIAVTCLIIVIILYYLFEQGQIDTIDPDITISVIFALSVISAIASLKTIFLKISSIKK